MHFFNDLPGGNVCFAHALFANARHKAIVLVQSVVNHIALFHTLSRVVLIGNPCQSNFFSRSFIHERGLELNRRHGILSHVDFHAAAGVRASARIDCRTI